MSQQSYDIIIIGSGIAGLYSAYKIKKSFPKMRIIVLERNGKPDIGGRAGNIKFQGTNVVTGAGIGRKRKDKLLIRLLHDLDIPYHEFMVASNYSHVIDPPCDVKSIFTKLKSEYREPVDHGKTFKQYAMEKLGKTAYQHFIICAGYTDYEAEGAHTTLHHYGFEDNYGRWTGLSIPWSALIHTLVQKLGGEQVVHTGRNVTQIMRGEGGHGQCNFTIVCENGSRYLGNKVILATTVSSVRSLLPQFSSIYRHIHSQPFLRVYGKFSVASMPIIQNYIQGTTVVPGPIHKIIPMNPEKGVYMIAYTDNRGAMELRNFTENTPANREHFCRLLEGALGIQKTGKIHLLSIKGVFWEEGTHYYIPLKRSGEPLDNFISMAQRPMDGIAVVGEMISMNQGWVEGALDSVEKVVTKQWIMS